MSPRFLLIAAAAMETALLVGVALRGEGIVAAFPAALWTILAAGGLYLAACALIERHPKLDTRLNVGIVIAVAVVMVGAQVPVIPTLSDDLFRYLWDGHVQSHGINPFQYPPDAGELAGIRTPWHPLINNPSISTIYPPVAQIVFLIASALWHHPAMLKLLLVGCLGAATWFAWDVLRSRGEPGIRIVWLVWNPLVALEIGHSGHVDALAAMFVMMAIWLVERGRANGAWAALAGGMMAKLHPALLLPALRRRHGGWTGPATFALVCLVVALPYLGAGSRLFVGLGAYSGGWRFNNAAFGVISWIMPDRAVTEALAPTLVGWFGSYGLTAVPYDHFAPLTRITVMVALIGTIWLVSGRKWEFDVQALWTFTALIAFLPAVFPWYAIVPAALLPLTAGRSRLTWPVAALTVLLPLSYVTLPAFHTDGIWHDTPGWIRLVEYGVPCVLAAVIGLRKRAA